MPFHTRKMSNIFIECWRKFLFGITLVKGWIKDNSRKLWDWTKGNIFTDRYQNNILHSFIFFAISLIIAFLWNIAPEIFTNNVHGTLKNTFLLIFLIGFIIIWSFISILSSSEKYGRDLTMLVSTSFLLILLYKFPNYAFLLWIILLLPIFSYPYFSEVWTPQKRRAWFTVLFILFSFMAGLLVITELYGDRSIEVYLNINGDVQDRYNSGNGTITCESFREVILAGMNVTCTINPPLDLTENVNVTFTDLWGNKEVADISKDLSFKAPKNIYNIYVEAYGINYKNESVHVSTLWEQTFYTLDEHRDRRENFGKSILWLLGFILITIPLMVNQFRSLIADKN
jgi:hypothetical protein